MKVKHINLRTQQKIIHRKLFLLLILTALMSLVGAGHFIAYKSSRLPQLQQIK